MTLCEACGQKAAAPDSLVCWLDGMCDCDEQADRVCTPHLIYLNIMTPT